MNHPASWGILFCPSMSYTIQTHSRRLLWARLVTLQIWYAVWTPATECVLQAPRLFASCWPWRLPETSMPAYHNSIQSKLEQHWIRKCQFCFRFQENSGQTTWKRDIPRKVLQVPGQNPSRRLRCLDDYFCGIPPKGRSNAISVHIGTNRCTGPGALARLQRFCYLEKLQSKATMLN